MEQLITFPYVGRGGTQVQAKGYSEYKDITTNYRGETLYEYSFIIQDITTQEILYTFPYTGTISPS